MQQYYTLEEAASRLQMSADELREMAKTKKIRAFQDRGSWRFRSQEIEELARSRGIGSDPEVQLADPRSPKPAKSKPPVEDEAIAIDFNLDKPASPSGKSGKSPARKASDSDVRLVMDDNLDFQIDLDSDVRLEQSPKPPKRKSKLQPGDSSVRLVGEKPSDSDVKVVPATTDSDVQPRPGKSPDSDIRLHDAGRRKKSAEDNIVTEEVIDLDAEESHLKQRSGEVKKPRVTQAASNPVLPTTSPFELSEPDMGLDAPRPPKGRKSPDKAKADRDSSSDFELVPFDQSKSPADLGSGEIPMLVGDEDVELGELGGPGASNSGINLHDAADSGISLEEDGSEEVEFELSLDSGVSSKSPKPAKSQPVAAMDDSSSEFELSLDDAPSDPSSSEFELSLDDSGDSFELKDDSGSDSEFELTLDDDGGLSVEDEAKDIFEPTNFDVPALDDESGSEAVAIDEADTDLDSDFDLSMEDSDSGSASQVVALEDEEEADTGAATVAKPRAKAKKKAAAVAVESEGGMELDLDLDDSAPKKKPKKAATAAADDEDEDEDEDDRAPVAAAPAEWGPLPALILFPTVIVMFIVGIMGFELVQGAYSYQRPGTRASNTLIHPIAKPIAEAMDAKLPD